MVENPVQYRNGLSFRYHWIGYCSKGQWIEEILLASGGPFLFSTCTISKFSPFIYMSDLDNKPAASVIAEKEKTKRTIIIVIVVLVVLVSPFVCCGMTAMLDSLDDPSSVDKSKDNNESTNSDDSEEAELNDDDDLLESGDVIEGLGRAQIEQEYLDQKALSDIKGDQYAESIKGKKVVWVGKVNKVDTEFLGDGYQIWFKIDGKPVIAKDPSQKYGDIIEDQTIKVSGNIDSLSDFLGITIYLNNPTIEVIE